MTQLLRSTLLMSAIAAGAALAPVAPAAALPLSPAAASAERAAQSDRSPLIQVRSHSRRVVAGVIGGMILGGIIASHWPYRYGYYYYPRYPVYPVYPPYPLYRSYPVDPAIAYCMRRFRSYDPYSMTYLGYDGRRHYCP
jgi:hypothetical protein